MNSSQREVMKKILYAVETGGQVYGNQRYDDFTEAYTNSDSEHAITIGAGAWYATEAQRLLKFIRETNPAQFKVVDYAGIGTDVDSADWTKYRVSKTSDKAKCIQRLISTDTGIQCQDALMYQQISEYEQSITEKYGEMAADGMMECINIIHQGGASALKRILAKTQKPYTAKTIYAALCTDPADKSNNNQVGDYVTRQEKVYEMIQKYCVDGSDSDMTESEIRQKVVNTAIQYLGCKESDGSHKKIIDIYNGHKPLARGYAVQYTDAWCATFVSAVSILCGLTDIMFTECGCGAMVQLYQNAGRWQENDAYVPSPGDIIMYYWNDSGSGDCVGYPDHVGIVVSVSSGSIKVIEGNKSNSVAYRTISVNGRYIRGYCLPNYASKASGASSGSSGSTGGSSTSSGTTSSGLNKTVKWNGVVTADSLNVCSWAGKENSTCSFSPLSEGVEVGVCDSVKASDGSIWYYIKYNGKYGFVHSGYVSKIVETDTSGTSSTKKVAYAKSKSSSLSGTYKVSASDGLNLRYEPGKLTDDNLILTIPNGDKVTCYGYYTAVNGVKWLLVAYKDKTGFVSSEYLKKQ